MTPTQSLLVGCWLLSWRFAKMLRAQTSVCLSVEKPFSTGRFAVHRRQLEPSPSKGTALDPWRATIHQCSSMQMCLSALTSFCHLAVVKWVGKTQQGTVHGAQARWSVWSGGLALGWAASSDSWIKAGAGPWAVSHLYFTRMISKLVPLIGLGGFFFGSSDGQRREKGDKANAFQLEELSRALCSLAALSTQHGDNKLSTRQCHVCPGAPQLGHLQNLGTRGGSSAFWRGKESLAFPPGADEDRAERSGSPVTWEASRNAGEVRHLEWEGADKARRIAREEQEAVWEVSLPCQGQGNCGGLQFLAWRWDWEPQSFLPSAGQKKVSF